MISGRKGVGAVITQSVNQSGGRDEPTIHPLLQFFNSQLRIIVSGGGGGQFVGWREREREREVSTAAAAEIVKCDNAIWRSLTLHTALAARQTDRQAA